MGVGGAGSSGGSGRSGGAGKSGGCSAGGKSSGASKGNCSAGKSSAAKGKSSGVGKAVGGFTGAIGKAMGAIGKAVGSLGKAVGKAASALGKVSGLVQRGMNSIMAPVRGLVNKALDKLPASISQFARPFANAFLGNPLALVSGNVLGGFGVLAAGMPTVSKLADLMSTLNSKSQTVGSVAEGQYNAQHIAAFRHAALLLG